MPTLLTACLLLSIPAKHAALKNLPDAAFSGIIEIRFKQPDSLVITPNGVAFGSRAVLDADTLVGPHRGVFLPQNLAFHRTFDQEDVLKNRRLAGYVRIATGTRSVRDAWLLVERLNELADVDVAYPVTVPSWPASPDLFDDEVHITAAPTGVDAVYSLAVPEARGKGIKIGDVEGGWNLGHEDLPTCTDYSEYPGIDKSRGTTDHGTAVLGEMFGVPNTFGVTGIAPEATCQVANAYTNNGQSWNIAKAMLRHASHMTAGDVVLLEVHGPGPNTKTQDDYDHQVGFVPGEYDDAVWDATDTLTKQGIIVVAAAGNGGENLDAPIYQGWFSPQTHHSGAIMVGAGAGKGSQSAALNARLWFSNYGARVDVHGWGDLVTTTGYGDAYNPTLLKEYTYQFAGTSSASPIVAASVAVVNGYLKALKQPVLKAADMQTLLVSTGTPQAGNTAEHIGPLPNLKAALGATSVCGDGKKAPAETCDDGNTVDGDGCSHDCTSDESCGNKILDSAAGEVCDDGNTKAGDGCRADCLGKEVCGDGQVDTAKKELCDDGNKQNGDGCTDDCKGLEVCGDGRIDELKGEVCDDDNTEDGDGCSKNCKSDETCGNSIVDKAADEECDDGNLESSDECDNSCLKPKTTTPTTPTTGNKPTGAGPSGPTTTEQPPGVAGCNCRNTNGTSDATGALSALALFAFVLARRRRR